jgi:AcrR family transcriptional regulator
VAAAVAVADGEGLEALSMARVAKELGLSTMSLYRYVTSKDELLQLMWNASAQGAEELVLEGDGWRPRLRSWAIIQRDMMDRHPWITQMPMAAPPLAPNSLAFVEHGLEALDRTSLGDADKLRVIGLLSSYALSEARMANDAARAAQAAAGAAAAAAETAADAAEPPPAWSYEALLRELADEQTYPRLHRLAWAADIGDSPSGFDEREEFLFGVDAILDGVQALIDRITRAGAWSPLVREELAVQRHDHAVAIRVGIAADVEAEVDGAHDAVAELLVDELLDGRAVDLEHLVEPVDRRIGRHRGVQRPAGRLELQRELDVVAQLQDRSGRPGLVLGHRVLAEQRAGRPGHGPADGLSDLRPGHPQPGLGGSDGLGRLFLGHACPSWDEIDRT